MMMNDDDADAVHWQRVPDKHHAWENHENESETESVNYIVIVGFTGVW